MSQLRGVAHYSGSLAPLLQFAPGILYIAVTNLVVSSKIPSWLRILMLPLGISVTWFY